MKNIHFDDFLKQRRKKLIRGLLFFVTFILILFFLNLFLKKESPFIAKLSIDSIIMNNPEFIRKLESLKNNNLDEISILVESIEKNKLELRKTKEEVDLNKLVLKFEGECWLEIYINDQLIEAQLFYDGDKYIKEIITPFKIIVGNADSVKGSYNNDEIDFITNANRLTKVNIINFTNE